MWSHYPRLRDEKLPLGGEVGIFWIELGDVYRCGCVCVCVWCVCVCGGGVGVDLVLGCVLKFMLVEHLSI